MYHLNVEDITCGHCAATVEKAVSAADPKAKVAVNLEAKTASIESEIGPDVFIAAIEDAGYRASIKMSCCMLQPLPLISQVPKQSHAPRRRRL
jgi:copper chaperone